MPRSGDARAEAEAKAKAKVPAKAKPPPPRFQERLRARPLAWRLGGEALPQDFSRLPQRDLHQRARCADQRRLRLPLRLRTRGRG